MMLRVLGPLGLLVAVSGVMAETIYDPPAITEWPSHDDIGQEISLDQAIRLGGDLFSAKFNQRDGAGRPEATGDSKPTPRLRPARTFERVAGPDAMSCAACHNQPSVGGSGDFVTNVFVGAHFSDPVTQETTAEVTSERNTTSLFGAGLLELLAREMTAQLHDQRAQSLEEAALSQLPVEVELKAKGVVFGKIISHPDGYIDYSNLSGVDYDLIVRPFGAKGVTSSLREFTIAAANQHHGMQAIERFGWERTGRKDFDGDGVELELNAGHITSMVLFQASLPPPAAFDASHPGFEIFERIGCNSCHVPRLPLKDATFLEPGPYNRPGTMDVTETDHVVSLPLATLGMEIAAFTDLRRHVICDADWPRLCNEMLSQDNVPTDAFMTTPLWNLAQTGPWCHRGDCASITEAIMAHGGEATDARERFSALLEQEKFSIVSFLMTLGADK